MVAMGANVHEMWGGQNYAHIPPQPYWVFILRIVQAVLGFLCLVMAAVGSATIGSWGGYGMTIFTAIFTFIFLGYISTARYRPNIYNAWAQLGLEIALNIFWLSSFGLMATLATAFGVYSGYGYNYGSGSAVGAGVGATKAGAAFTAFEWISFIATIVGFGMSLHRWRLGGASASMGGGMGGEHKMNSVPVNQSYAQQPPVGQQYAPQQYPEQHYQQQNMA